MHRRWGRPPGCRVWYLPVRTPPRTGLQRSAPTRQQDGPAPPASRGVCPTLAVVTRCAPGNARPGFYLAFAVANGLARRRDVRSIFTYLAMAIVVLSPGASLAQTLPDQIDAFLSALPDNTWSALVENEAGSVTYYERDADTGL